MTPPGNVVIVGAGVCGLAAALGLARRGVGVELVERRADVDQLVAGRPSINLTLGVRGLEALDRLDLAADVVEAGVWASVRHIHRAVGEAVVQPYGTAGEAILSIRRNDLAARLLDRVIATDQIRVRLDVRVEDVEPDGTLTLRAADGAVTSLTASLVIGADGLNSVVRRAICRATGAPGAEPVDAECRWIELAHPADWPGSQPAAVDVWPRDPLMVIAFPNRNGVKTVLIFAPDGVELPDHAELGDLLPELSVTAEAYKGSLDRQDRIRVVRTPVWSVGRLCVVGDAAHAVTPYLGQGANAALADAELLLDLVDEGVGWDQIGARFASIRQPEMACLGRLTDQHYQELAHGMADERAVVRHEVRMLLARHDPVRFQPIYNRVAFTRGSLLRAEREHADEDLAIAPVVDAVLATLHPGATP